MRYNADFAVPVLWQCRDAACMSGIGSDCVGGVRVGEK